MQTPQSKNLAELFVNWRSDILAIAEQSMPALFKAIPDALLDYAERAPNNRIRSRFFEGLKVVEQAKPQIRDAFLRHLGDYFDRPQGDQVVEHFGDSAFTESELELLNNDALERQLLLQRIRERAERDYHGVLHQLSQRLSTLRRHALVRIEDIPANPARLADALESACGQLEISTPVRAVLYRQFVDKVIVPIMDCYADLNKALKDAGVEPNAHNNRVSAVSPHASARPAAAAADCVSELDEASVSNASAVAAIRSLLGARRKQAASAGPMRDSKQPAAVDRQGRTSAKIGQGQLSSAQVVRAIVEHGDQVASQLPQIGIFDEASNSIVVPAGHLDAASVTLSSQRDEIKDLIGRNQLADFDEDTIDIIGQLFEVMLNEPALPDPVKALLSYLHTPYLKIALHDGELLTDRDHPARQLLNELVDVGMRWVIPHKLDKGGFPCLQSVTKALIEQAHPDKSLTARLLVVVREKVVDLKAGSRLRSNRTLETEKGRSKLEQAKAMADRHLRQLLTESPDCVRSHRFLSGPWRDYLALLLLRNGLRCSGGEWRHAMDLSQEIIRTEKHCIKSYTQASESVETLHKALVEVVGKLVPHLLGSVKTFILSLSGPLQTRAEVTVIETVAESSTKAAIEKPHLTPQQEQLAQQLRESEEGSLFQLQADESGQRQTVELAWYNFYTDRLLLVDHTGVKVALITADELAVAISDGRAQRLNAQSLSFFERALRVMRGYLSKVGKVEDLANA